MINSSKTAIITGGLGVIGLSIAQNLYKNNINII